MRYRILAVLSLVLLLVYCSSKENLTERFKSDISDYCDAYNKGDWNKVVGMIYPKLYTVTSKEDMIKTMSSLDSMGMKTTIRLESIDKTSEIVTQGEEKFCLVAYRTKLNIAISNKIEDKIGELKEGLVNQFGKENLKFDGQKKTFEINALQAMIAISPKDKNDWKYIEHDSKQPDYITNLIIPKEVLEKFSK